ncbi:EexN family lipoprotein [Bradyrhizobium sp. BR13661]|jgi:hypothetical protein|uniref:EexN family lipoprotein n=1 Tax=Bradyrhizobium sp. BR13661 TaxID=2940622 RepID=UPI002473A274|nr:EexN family lipoprotein [Bradyrhizobium sp. BR13661]
MRPPALLLAFAIALSGCEETSKTETKTVGWFLDHRNELDTVLNACGENPGELGRTPQCVNANEARNKLTVQEMEDALK